jgi:hypothetical protein
VSWDAYLSDDRGHDEGQWNYTHNTNRMIAAALEQHAHLSTPPTTGPLGPAIGPAWFRRLDGASGKDGQRYLDTIIRALEAAPGNYRAMNPENGWGDYDSLLKVLREMRDAVPDWPTVWSVSG